ncbi:MAG: hypothetical protein ACK4N4_06375 [Burkholderiales bacterium]
MKTQLAVAVLLAMVSIAAPAADKEAYDRRVADNEMALFQQLDRDRDGRLSRDEAKGDLTLGPRFSDIDINRDDVITREEMLRHIEQAYGVKPAS